VEHLAFIACHSHDGGDDAKGMWESVHVKSL